MAGKLNPAVQAKKIKAEQEKEKKRQESHSKSIQKAHEKRSPKEKAYYDYVTKMNMLGHGSTKKDVEAAEKHLRSFD